MSATPDHVLDDADWHRRVVNRSLRTATRRSIDRGSTLVAAAAALLERSNGDGFTVQDVANEAGQSLRTLYQYFESKDDLLLAVFEEAMRAYAVMIRDSIAELTDPLDRLTGALLTAIRLPDHGSEAMSRVLTRLRLQLAQADPALVALSELPVISLLRELVDAAATDGSVTVADPDGAAFLLFAVNTAAITNDILNPDPSRDHPTPTEVVTFCLKGVGVEATPRSLDRIASQLSAPKKPVSFLARRVPKEAS